MSNVDWSLVQQFSEAGRRLGEQMREKADSAARREREKEILTFLETRVLPWLDGVEATLDTMDGVEAGKVLKMANDCKTLLNKVQPASTRPLPRGEDPRPLSSTLLEDKSKITARVDALIAKALKRVRA
jgi:hypothetical protein